MPIIYNGFELRPVQSLTYSRSIDQQGDGRSLGSSIRATIAGTIVPVKIDGVFASVATDSRLTTVLEQQKLIRDALSVQGKIFEVQGWDGAAPTKFNAKVVSIDFNDGLWFDKSDYSITFESVNVAGETDGLEYVDSSGETWNFEEGDLPRTRKVTHNVSAKGKTVYDATGQIPKKAWEYAKDFCENRLGLGYETATDAQWSPLSGKDLATISESKPLSTNSWNYVVNETIDETDGNYSASESWTLNEHNYVEEYTITVRKVDDQPSVMVTALISGTVHGLYATQNDYDAKYTNAKARWLVVKGLLNGRASAAAGISLATHPSAFSVDHDPVGGSISYQVEFNNREIVGDTFDYFNVSKRTSLEDYRTSVIVDGTVVGVAHLDDETDPNLKMQRAEDRWDAIKGLMLSRAVAGSGVTDLKAFPIQASVSPNVSNGSISYTFEFDNRDPENVRDDFTVESRYSRDDGLTTISISGTITGLRVSNASDPFSAADREERYRNAKAYYSGKSGQLLSVAALYVSTDKVNSVVVEKSESHNPLAGTVGYQQSYNTRGGTCVPGALSAIITMTEDAATPVIAVIPIPGRQKGPLFQDMSTVTPIRRSVTAEVVMPIPKDVCSSIDPPAVDLTKYKPTGSQVNLEQNQTSWSPTTGRLTKTLTWISTP